MIGAGAVISAGAASPAGAPVGAVYALLDRAEPAATGAGAGGNASSLRASACPAHTIRARDQPWILSWLHMTACWQSPGLCARYKWQ